LTSTFDFYYRNYVPQYVFIVNCKKHQIAGLQDEKRQMASSERENAGTPRQSVSLAIVGSGGAGAITAGAMLLEAAGRIGLYGLMTRSVGPQIRGGEAAALLRFSSQPVACMGDNYDLLIAIDWRNVHRFATEIALKRDSLVIGDPRGGDVPQMVPASGAVTAEIAMKALAKDIPGGRQNMIALGLAVGLLGLPKTGLFEVIEKQLGKKGDEAIKASKAAIEVGLAEAAKLDHAVPISAPAADAEKPERWMITGNEAAAMGAIRGGIRFAAAYPITPATEILEWLAPALTKVGGVLVQAEDELASINMAIGASFGGKPSLTATSGPGLALMIESLGLATAAEIPIVVVDVMRGGPSTGIPTKSEQSDLNIAVHGCHGDAPHLVLAPLSVGDCLFTTQWAAHLAEAVQAPAVVLSDQFLGQTRALIERPADVAFIAQRAVVAEADNDYRRYALTAEAVSPMAIPGVAGGQYTADGLTHDEAGTPSSAAGHHEAQLDKRRDKIENFTYGDHWADIEGEGEVAIVTWGSLTGPAREAIARLAEDGIKTRLVALRLIAPLQVEQLAAALEGCKRVLVVEQSHSGQFYRYLRSMCDLPGEVRAFHRPGPLPFRPSEIDAQIRQWRP
jgi:2-oxoglutarate ferredoxin oxidoreductase subunit alpha